MAYVIWAYGFRPVLSQLMSSSSPLTQSRSLSWEMNIRGSYNILSLSRDAGKFQAGNVYTARKKIGTSLETKSGTFKYQEGYFLKWYGEILCPHCAMQYWSEQICPSSGSSTAPFAECSLDSGEDWMNSNTVQLSWSCTVCRCSLKHVSSQSHKPNKYGWWAVIIYVSHVISLSPYCFKDHSISQIATAQC